MNIIGICLIVWMIISLIFVCTLVGLLMFVPKDTYQNGPSTPSSWITIGKELLSALIEK